MVDLVQFGQHLQRIVPQFIKQVTLWKDELAVHTKSEFLVPLAEFLKKDEQMKFQQLVELTATDYPADPDRFHLNYMLLSHQFRIRLQIRLAVPDLTPVPSLTGIYPSANWPEREVYDMYGITFTSHPDLRRILTDYGFEGHPLRKDFPLSGFTQVRWDGEKKRVVEEPVKLTQEFRRFDLKSPWETLSTQIATIPLSEKELAENIDLPKNKE
jgi:NADH/F420H2 dehydrogenase subunit C